MLTRSDHKRHQGIFSSVPDAANLCIALLPRRDLHKFAVAVEMQAYWTDEHEFRL
jgi:hypothetical protein